jgi:hypothetical protein
VPVRERLQVLVDEVHEAVAAIDSIQDPTPADLAAVLPVVGEQPPLLTLVIAVEDCLVTQHYAPQAGNILIRRPGLEQFLLRASSLGCGT